MNLLPLESGCKSNPLLFSGKTFFVFYFTNFASCWITPLFVLNFFCDFLILGVSVGFLWGEVFELCVSKRGLACDESCFESWFALTLLWRFRDLLLF